MRHRPSPSAGRMPLVVALLAGVGSAAVTLRVDAATTGANGTHDPSRMIASNGKFYVYSTGGGSKSSTDGLAWTAGPAIFPSGIPSSATAVVSSNEGVWAPDVIYRNGQYYLYYAVANAQNACAVGLVTSPTLDPGAPNYKWTDRGVVVSNTGSDTFCAIDPCPFEDASGDFWLTFGSGYTKPATNETIYAIRLDAATGLPSATDTTKYPLEPGHIEASYVYYHSGYYYLFWNSGGCCSGASSSYTIHVARSTAVTGPYGVSRVFLQSSGAMHGPGQIGIYDQCGASRFTYHIYPDTGGSILGENELTWGSDGWPVAGAESTTPLKPCGPLGEGAVPAGDGGAMDASAGSDGSLGDGAPLDGDGSEVASSVSGSSSAETATGAGTGSGSMAGGSMGGGATGDDAGDDAAATGASAGSTAGVTGGGMTSGSGAAASGVAPSGANRGAGGASGTSNASSGGCGVAPGDDPSGAGVLLLMMGLTRAAMRRRRAAPSR